MKSNATNNASALLYAWESGQRTSPWQRPAALLAALSGMPFAEALDLGVARRDAALIAWRAALFGNIWQAFAQCPLCDTMLEYQVPHLSDTPEFSTEDAESVELECCGCPWRVRLPNSHDIHEASQCADRATGRSFLLRRMLSEDDDPDAETGATILATVADAHRGLLTLDLKCCSCPHAWTVAFDPGEFFWREIRAAARRILREIDLIARVYHWSEEQILALSDARRREYLQMVQ